MIAAYISATPTDIACSWWSRAERLPLDGPPTRRGMAAPSELTRTTLAVLFVGGLIATSFWILWPFLPALIWATTLVVATWPIMLHVQAHLWRKRSLAVAVMTIALLVIFVLPFWLAITTITEH